MNLSIIALRRSLSSAVSISGRLKDVSISLAESAPLTHLRLGLWRRRRRGDDPDGQRVGEHGVRLVAGGLGLLRQRVHGVVVRRRQARNLENENKKWTCSCI